MNRRSFVLSTGALAIGSRASAAAARPRLRSAICAYSFREELKSKTMSYGDLVTLAVDNEVDGLDLTVYWFPDTSDGFLLPLKRQAYKAGVEIYSISIRSDMCRPTRELQAKEAADVHKWVDAAEKLGAGHIRVFGGTVPKGSTEDQAAGWVVEVLKRAADYAAKKGVILGLENHGGITERAERIVEIVKKVDSPWVGINLDSGNFRRDAYAQMEMCVPYAVNVQMKVEVRGAEGKTEPCDWKRVARMLASGGYRGYAALEYESKADARSSVPPLLKKLNATLRSA